MYRVTTSHWYTMIPVVLALAAVLSVTVPPLLLASETTYSIHGTVNGEDARPIGGATVRLIELNRTTAADQDGLFTFHQVPAGTYTLTITSIGHADLNETVIVNADIANQLFTLVNRPTKLGGVTVVGSSEDRQRMVASLRRVPGSTALVSAQEISRTRGANFNDVLRFVPGVWVQPRFGAADESQLSIRGSGLRNNFHLRGVNLLINGMPYRNTDGFTDFESIEMLATDNIQIYKGGNALRYGGATLGGAINFETKTGYTSTPVMLSGTGGSFGYYKAQVASGSTFGKTNYYASYVKTQIDGYRDYSMQRRNRINLSVGHAFSAAINTRLYYLFARVEEDLPGTLTRALFDADPSQATVTNTTNRWGRDFDLHHVGVQVRTKLSAGTRLEITPYVQYRDIIHPIFRVLDQVNRDIGVESRFEGAFRLGGSHQFSLGSQLASGNSNNEQYDNTGGVAGTLRKQQKELANLFALYGEVVWHVQERVSTVVGARFDRSTRRVDDRFLSDGDQSGERVYEFVMPKLGLLYDFRGAFEGQLYVNVSRSVEPPLLSELNSFTKPGLVEIEAQDAWQYEIGIRGRSGLIAMDLSTFLIELDNEIVNINVLPFPGASFTVPTYENAPETRHLGVEAGAVIESETLRRKSRSQIGLGGRVAYTYAYCKFVDHPTYGGNDIPGQPDHNVQAEFTLRLPAGISLRPSIEWVPEAFAVNSANSAFNDGWAVWHARAEYDIVAIGGAAHVEIRNVGNRVYSPAVVVDAANGAFYQPGDERSVYAGLSLNL